MRPFVVRPPGAQIWKPVVFYRLPGGERYVHMGGRATPLVEDHGTRIKRPTR